MAIFSITFNRGAPDPPEYEDYINSVSAQCTDDNLQRPIVFDDTATGAYNVGHNYTGGAGAQYLKILSYTDTAVQHDVVANVDENIPGFIPSQLYNTVTSAPLVYPTVIDITELDTIGTFYNGAEVICSTSSKYEFRRTRIIEYTILDSNSSEGPVRYATIYLTAQPT